MSLIDLLDRARRGDDPFVLGAIPSPTDTRDYRTAVPTAPTAEAVTVKGAGLTPVYNQQGGTCTGYSAAAVLSMLEYAETGRNVAFDGAELHHRIVASYEAGAFPRDVLEDIRLHGAEARLDAKSTGLFRIEGYAQVDMHDPAAVLAALAHGPLHIATWLSQGFFDAWYGRTREHVGIVGDGLAYHAMAVVAAGPLGMTVQNSWGEGGGFGLGTARGGFLNLSWAYVAKEVGEMWSVADKANGAVDGYIKTHEQPVDELTNVRLVKRADRPAVYVVVGDGRWWVQSQAALDAMRLRGTRIENLTHNDAVFGLPVIGPDAPLNARA